MRESVECTCGFVHSMDEPKSFYCEPSTLETRKDWSIFRERQSLLAVVFRTPEQDRRLCELLMELERRRKLPLIANVKAQS